MKKINFFYAAAAALAMTACTSNEALEQLTAQQVEGLEPINLGYASTAATASKTRGTGTVGNLNTDESAETAASFAKKNLYVLMTCTDENGQWDFTKVAGLTELPFDGTYVARAEAQKSFDDQTGKSVWGINYKKYNGSQTRYYPTNYVSQFFAVHLDDAATTTPDFAHVEDEPAILPENIEAAKVVEFTIDGNNDLMAGKAWNLNEEEAAFDGYSAKTSRAGIVPRIHMEHLLTRFTFEVVPGHSNCKGMFVEKVALEDLNDHGQIIAAYKGGDVEGLHKDVIVWDEESTNTFYLKSAETAVLDPDNIDPENDPYSDQEYCKDLEPMEITEDMVADEKIQNKVGKKIGEAMFVRPTVGDPEPIKMKVWTKHITAEGTEIETETPVKVQLKGTDGLLPFEAGYSYNVKIIVYGISEIEIEAELEPWIDGGDLDADIEDDAYITE